MVPGLSKELTLYYIVLTARASELKCQKVHGNEIDASQSIDQEMLVAGTFLTKSHRKLEIN